MTSAYMPTERIQDVCTALLKIPALQAEATRSLFLEETGTMLGRMLTVTRYPEARLDLYSTLRACDREPGGLAAFLRVVASFHRGSAAQAEAQQIVDVWAHDTCEARLVHQLVDVSAERLAAAAAAAGLITLPLVSTQMDIAVLIHDVGWQQSVRWGTPALLALAELLAYEPTLGVALRQWVAEAAARLGIDSQAVAAMQRIVARHREDLSSEEIESISLSPVAESEPEPDMRKTIIIEQTPSLISDTVIRGGVPARNPYFTGRDKLLTDLEVALKSQRRASVLPETLHGLGGVGKTQLAIEYTYRHSEEYQLIWWIAADQPSAVRSSLSALASRLGLPTGPSMDQTVRTVLDALATTAMHWLLVYDNANEPSDLENLIPSAGGHLIITSRNPEWAVPGASFEVDVFTRAESKLMLRKRRPEMPDRDAEKLSERLGDLPLALEQAVSWIISTLTSVDDYLTAFDRQSRVLLAEGRPRQYPTTVLTFVALALNRLRETAPVSAMLLELMAFFGPDPIPASLLWAGRGANVIEPLRSALSERIEIGRAVRDLARFGLARVDSPGQRIQVHRLVQLIMREELTEERRARALSNARALLAAANPGYPDDQETWPRHAEIAPHIRAAGLIQGDLYARRAVLDHLRYVYNIGDYEGCRDLAEEILAASAHPLPDGDQDHPSDDPLTLLARRRYADALRSLGDFSAAREEGRRALEEMRAALGEQHEYTLGAVISVGADLRIVGDFVAARELDEGNLRVHRDVLGDADHSTVRAMLVVAIDRRMSGDMQAAYEIDVEAERLSRRALGDGDSLTFQAIAGQARDLYGLGRYAEALDLQQRHLPAHTALLGSGHAHVLMADSLVAIVLRKVGRLAEAVTRSHESYRTHSVRFGPAHPQTLAATMTYANALRSTGDLHQARLFATQGYEGYQALYGARHPMTSSAAVNLAIILRAENSDWQAMTLDEATLEIMRETLSDDHPFVLCLRGNLTNDLVRTHSISRARELSTELLEASRRVRGGGHPNTLQCAVNTALDTINTGDGTTGRALLESTIASMIRIVGPDHPDITAARQRKRAEFDIEPPPW
jgi:tetratricopeptide (TPR) repeat protein